MCGRAGIILSAIFASTLSLNVSTSLAGSTSPVGAEIKSRFDLPAEPLDKALRDFAVQANCNISYEPSIVAGLQAPAIKGEFTVDGVLSIMLTGTRLRAVNVNEDTIQILEKPAATTQESTAIQKSDYAPGTGVVRVATVDSDAPPSAWTPTDAKDSDSTVAETKAHDKKELDEIVVTGTHIRGAPPSSPVIEIGREEIDRSGYTSIADLMLSLPQNFGGGYNAATMVNNTGLNNYADNPTGASVPNLRGLGPGWLRAFPAAARIFLRSQSMRSSGLKCSPTALRPSTGPMQSPASSTSF
jgi:iron complex outermembrane receptor protein